MKGKTSFAIALWIYLTFASANLIAYSSVNAIGIDQGLSNNSVRCIYQDKKGFMWFGTYDGLNRYDGYGFKIFRNKFGDNNSLINNYIFSIEEDQASNLWVGTHAGLCIYNNVSGKFSTLNYRPFNAGRLVKIDMGVRKIKADRYGNMLIGTLGAGLLFKASNAGVTVQIPVIIGGKAIVDYDVQSIKIDHAGTVWIFIPQVGLGKLDNRTMRLELVNSNLKYAFCIEPDGDDIWVGTAEGLFLYQGKQKNIIKVIEQGRGKLTFNVISDMVLDSHKDLWLAINGGGINIFNTVNHKPRYLTDNNGKSPLSNDAAYTIYNDRDDRKWIGVLNGGINVVDYQKNRFKTLNHDPAALASLPKNSIYALYEQDKDHLWIGTEGAGVSIWNRSTKRFRHYKDDPQNPHAISDNIITGIIEDHRKNIWISTFFGGVNKYNPASDNFDHYKCVNPNSHIENRVVSSICEDKDHNIWVGTMKGGGINGALYIFDRGQNAFKAFDLNLSDLYGMITDREGELWAGTLSRLVKIDRKTKKNQFFELNYYVRSIFEDSKQQLWVGTEGGGLVLFDRKLSKIIARYTTDNGLCNNSVLNILEDRQGNLWLSTFSGLSKFNQVTNTFKNYFKSDGLQSNQFHYNSHMTLQSGELAFGGIEGLNIFYPETIKEIDNNPSLVLSGLGINNAPVEKNAAYVTKTTLDVISALEVPYNKAVFSFDFTALEFTAPDKIKYAYFMEGWDNGWTQSDNNRSANYTHLDEGHYTFRVKCTNAEGKWMSKEISLHIIVLPPWYRTWWAYLLYAVVALGLIYTYFFYKTRQTKLSYEIEVARVNMEREKAERGKEHAEKEKIGAELDLERAEHEKERILNDKEKELNDKQLSFFTNISHEFRTPLTLIINPAKTLIEKYKETNNHIDNEVNVIYRNARRMLSLVDQLLHFKKADNGLEKLFPVKLNFYKLCREVYLCFVQQAAYKHIKYEFNCDNTELELYADRAKMEIVLYNLLSNALKYTPEEGKVLFLVKDNDEKIIVTVADTGCGINEDEGELIFEKFYRSNDKLGNHKPGFGIGLYLVKHFVQAHHGQINYTSGASTEFTLALLKGNLHFEAMPSNEQAFTAQHDADSLIEESVFADQANDNGIRPEKSGNTFDNELFSQRKVVLITDDDPEMRLYISSLFSEEFNVYEADSGEEGLNLAKQYLPDIIISDIKMSGISGIDFCKIVKEDQATAHIPVILLTGTSSLELRLEGAEGGADDYIIKPFEKEYLLARVNNLLKNRNNLQNYFYNRITHQTNDSIKVSSAYKDFIERCIGIVERHLDNPDFQVATLLQEIGMSHSNLYRKVKSVSGATVTAFIRLIKLRKAAEIMISHDYNVNEVATMVGFNSPNYFSTQFSKVFGMKPAAFIKKYRGNFGNEYVLQKDVFKPGKNSSRDV